MAKKEKIKYVIDEKNEKKELEDVKKPVLHQKSFNIKENKEIIVMKPIDHN